MLQTAMHEKPYFLFPNVLKRWCFQKITLEYDLSCIIRKDDFDFPKNMILVFIRKMKDYLSETNTWKYDVSFEYSENVVFPKK